MKHADFIINYTDIIFSFSLSLSLSRARALSLSLSLCLHVCVCVCMQFGPRGDLPQHGFCRKSNDWEVEESSR